MSRLDALTEQKTKRLLETSDRVTSGKQSFASGALSVAGTAAMSAFDPFLALAQPAISRLPQGPHSKKQFPRPLTTAADKISNISRVQDFAQTETSVNFERNIEDINALVQFTPAGKGSGFISRGAKESADSFASMARNAVPNLQEKAVTDLAETYREVAGTTMKSNRTLLRSEARGKDPAQFLAERNITPTIEDGKIHTFEQSKTLRDSADPLNTSLEAALREVQYGVPKLKVDDLRTAALKYADEMDITETARETVKRDINAEYDLLTRRYGTDVDLVTTNSIKKTNWRATPFDSTKPFQKDVNYIIGRSAKEAIENAVPAEAFGVKELNNHLGDIYDSAKFLDSLEGKAVRGGRLGKYFARTIGAAIGSQGGLAGGVLGGIVGDRVAEILQQSTFGGPMKQLILKQLKKENPQAYQAVMDYLKKAGLDRDTRPLLPAPKAGQSTLNEGRAITAGVPSEGEYIGRDMAIAPSVARSTQALPEPSIRNPLDTTLPPAAPQSRVQEIQTEIAIYEDLLSDSRIPALLDKLGSRQAARLQDTTLDEILADSMGTNRRSAKLDTWDIYESVEEAQKAYDDYKGMQSKIRQLKQELKTTDPSTPGTQAPDSSGSAAFGAAAGIQPDEEGNVSFDPLTAALGFLGIKAVKGGPSKILPNEVLRDAIIKKLDADAPVKALTAPDGLFTEAKDLAQYFKDVKNPSPENIQRAMEVLRLLGHDVKPIQAAYLEAAQTAFKQLRDDIGRYTDEVIRE